MTQFDYNNYLKKNPLLKEEETSEAKEDYLVRGDSQVIIRMEDALEQIQSSMEQLIQDPTRNVRGLANHAMEGLEEVKEILKLKK
jgi:hypothetical protein